MNTTSLTPTQQELNVRFAKALGCCMCGGDAFKLNRTSWLCVRHWRLSRMRHASRSRGKSVPSMSELESLVPDGMSCPVCDRKMVWLKNESRSLVISLQHNRNGSYLLICLSCNSRHQHFSGDDFYKIPKDQKWCPGCKSVKPNSDFSKC